MLNGTHMANPDELLTSPQSAALLEVSLRTVHRLAEAGELAPAHRLPGPNGAFLFRRGDVEALRDARAKAPSDEPNGSQVA